MEPTWNETIKPWTLCGYSEGSKEWLRLCRRAGREGRAEIRRWRRDKAEREAFEAENEARIAKFHRYGGTGPDYGQFNHLP